MRETEAGISVPEESVDPAAEGVCLGEMAGNDHVPGHPDDQAFYVSPDCNILHHLPGDNLQSGSHLSAFSSRLDAWRRDKGG